MKIYRYIVTTKAKDSSGNKPTHYLKAFENKGDTVGEFVASLWSKEGKDRDGNGTYKFLSGELKSEYKDHTDKSKSRDGFVIIKERDLKELLKLTSEQGADIDIDDPF